MIGRTLAHYRIVASLGRGGMGEVYRAEDTRLGREIALKVLPPEMAGDASRRQRFEREARAVAALNHPSIVTLHSVEHDDGVHFITMELVEGKPLSAHITAGGMPADRFLALALPLTGAIAAAHAAGITHRDLKPDNVMVTPDGTIKVLDFGLAKRTGTDTKLPIDSTASASPPTQSVTEEGKILGTLTYMSPEQAEGKPVDARSDIFSLGVVFYEMLAGRRPFAGETTASLVASILRDEPPPATSDGGAIPSHLDRLVRRCLAKDPDRRYQTATDLRIELENLRQESQIDSSGAAREAREVREPAGDVAPSRGGVLARLLIAYLVVGAAIVILARLAVREIGLPDWVMPGVLALLGLGLPILVATAVVERRLDPHWLTWRKAILGGVLAFATLGLVTAGYFVTRSLGIGPAASLVSAGVLSDGSQVVIADVENLTEDELLGEAVREALSVDLAQSTVVTPVWPTRLREALRRMERDPDDPIDLTTAREIAEREGIESIVAGQVSPAGSGYVLSLRLLASDDGKVLAAFRVNAPTRDDVIPAIDELSGKLRTRIGESLKSTRDRAPLEHVTTSSLDALRKYSRAVSLSERPGDEDRAIALLQEAVALDTTFAMAYRKLGIMVRSQFRDRTLVNESLTKAFRHRDRLTERERCLAEAAYYWVVRREREPAMRAYERMLELNPHDHWALNNLGMLYEDRNDPGDIEHALDLFERAVEASRSGNTVTNLVDAQITLGRYDQAEAMVETLAHDFPAIWRHEFRMLINSVQLDYAAAESSAVSMYELASTPSDRRRALASVGETYWIQGKIKDAQTIVDRRLQLCAQQQLPGEYLEVALETAGREFMLLANRDRARGLIDEALTRFPLSSIPFEDRSYQELVINLAALGEHERADELLREYQREHERLNPDEPFESGIDGILLHLDGRYDEAARHFDRALGVEREWLGTLAWAAESHHRAGHLSEARAYWERYLNKREVWRQYWDQFWLPMAYVRLGQLCEQAGERDQARVYLDALADLWRDADPELQTMRERIDGRSFRLGPE